MSDYIDAEGTVMKVLAASVRMGQSLAGEFEVIAEDCENFNNGGCILNIDGCTLWGCPLAKED